MKRYFIFMAIILGMIAPSVSAQTAPKKKVAVYVSGEDVKDSYKKVINSKLVSSITRSRSYTVVERNSSFLTELEKEIATSLSGDVRDDQIAAIGQRFGVRYVLVADISEVFEEMFISARMIDVETAQIVNAAEANAYVESMEGLTGLAENIIAGLMKDGLATNGGQNRDSNQTEIQSGRDFVESAAGLNMKMVWVEGGEFLMGGTSEQGSEVDSDEQVIRRVKLDSYYICECEVTQEQWAKVMGTSIQQQAGKAGQSTYRGIGPDYPMYYVSWEEAQAFCSELSRMTGRTYCLPTEAQWEYAARGGKNADGSKYSGSWSIDAVAWYDGNSGSNTHPVKNKRANALGLYDMSGNVWEWCSDWYGANYNVNDTNNPTGPSSGSYRVLRGGGWSNDAQYCRVSYRSNDTPGGRYYDSGFRVVVLP
ncbi:MAG: SUMF1/EgtB/PvdO family nonheme iron enzyme [Alistipes sp.]|nr:SUMF1/EgtB/PvdO family nonheme iron enzyme [Alistipes sp.]